VTTAGNVALFAAFVFAALFVALYGLARKWWRTETGWHLMTFTLSLAVITGRLSAGVLTGWTLSAPERLGVYALIAVGLGWRLGMFVRTLLRERHNTTTPRDS
jgi:hypothetical protein